MLEKYILKRYWGDCVTRIGTIFGAGSGIGKFLSENIKGFDVIRKPDIISGCDILDFEDVLDFTKNASFVVNSVGIMEVNPIEKTTTERFERICNVNLVGSFNVVKACKINKVKNLVLISSNSGLSGFSNMSAYCASKFGIIGLAQVAAKEMAAYKGICNVICPSALKYGETPMTVFQGKSFMENMKISDTTKLDETLSSRIPMKRLCTKEDILEWVQFLADMKSDFFTGQVISLTGGMNMVR